MHIEQQGTDVWQIWNASTQVSYCPPTSSVTPTVCPLRRCQLSPACCLGCCGYGSKKNTLIWRRVGPVLIQSRTLSKN